MCVYVCVFACVYMRVMRQNLHNRGITCPQSHDTHTHTPAAVTLLAQHPGRLWQQRRGPLH